MLQQFENVHRQCENVTLLVVCYMFLDRVHVLLHHLSILSMFDFMKIY